MSSNARHDLILPRQFLRMCREQMRRPKVADSTGVELTGAGLLTRTLIVRRLLRRLVLADDEKRVGLLLPPTVASVVVNAALAIDSRVAVNLNYTVSSDVMNDCIHQCGIRHVLTSRRAMERFNLKLDADVVYLEDCVHKITWADKLAAATAAWLEPMSRLERRLGLDRVSQDDLLTIIFTSGSTGRPKGVMLTHRNVGSNVGAVDDIIHLDRDDVLLGILPIFHAFGYTTTLWTVLTLPPMGIYHYSPLEAREVGKLCRKHGATIMITTPTFVRSYLRRCDREDFAKLDVVFTGAEKLAPELADAFERHFGVRPVEGYGTTELSPVVCANIPPSRASSGKYAGVKPGTVGRTLPGISAKVVDLDTGEDLGANESGMLLVTGPNVMKGYYGRPDLTADVLRDGWYVTGDVATIDDEGFITITGRISRFSKIAGEMIPHIRVEEAIGDVLGLDEEEVKIAVTSVPDAKKGERLVVLHTDLEQEPTEICRKLAAAGLPPLWIPSADSFRRVELIPLLGTGKLDLKRLKEVAIEEFVGALS
jgi:acyl-[acyl-carrier-protein]-phospholipid O-acyltransferase / long-chain-fatty-acid--[acyl-carrier-protein] ligase